MCQSPKITFKVTLEEQGFQGKPKVRKWQNEESLLSIYFSPTAEQ